jgi:hypothetical protein
MTREIKAVLVVTLMAAILLTAMMEWLSPCIGATRFQPCQQESLSDLEPSDPPCYLAVCDFLPTAFERLTRILASVSLMPLVGMASAFASVAKPVRAAAYAGACTVLLTFILTLYLFPYFVINLEALIGSAVLITLSIVVSSCGGLIARMIQPNKTMEPTR